MDQFDAAWGVFLQEAGSRLNAHLGVEGKPSVPPDVLHDATLTLARQAIVAPQPTESDVPAIQAELVAQALEQLWEGSSRRRG